MRFHQESQMRSYMHLQPTPVPNDRVFQGVFASQAAQVSRQREDSTIARAPGGLLMHVEATTPFGRGVTLPLGLARGRQVPMDISSSGSMPPGGLQQAQADTPRDRPILDMPREQVLRKWDLEQTTIPNRCWHHCVVLLLESTLENRERTQ